MRKNIWMYICFCQMLIILIGVLIICLPASTPSFQNADLTEYLDQFSDDNNFLPDRGYISDAKTAKIVGSQIIDELTGNKTFGGVSLKYDAENRLWLVQKGYLFGGGGFVVIDQDSGKIIKALLSK